MTWLQSALLPAGPQAARIAALWPPFFWGSVVIWLLVMGALLYGAFRRRRAAPGERAMARSVGAASAGTIVMLFALLALDLAVGRALTLPPEPAAVIEVTGRQWWWEVEYADSVPSRRVTTANEIHVPVGRPVLIRLSSSDVIHSLWVPSLAGKKDLIPGHRTSLWLQADTPGVYRGQCAEFCGVQHAKMALLVIAEPPERYRTWLARQREPAAPPADSLARRGLAVFLGSSCVLCHAIAGTPAASRMGPDLTHLASRRTLAAGSLPNRRGALAGWIADPQRIKPGSRMPPNPLGPGDLRALLAYLEGLR